VKRHDEEVYEFMRDVGEAKDVRSEMHIVQQGQVHIGRSEDNWT